MTSKFKNIWYRILFLITNFERTKPGLVYKNKIHPFKQEIRLFMEFTVLIFLCKWFIPFSWLKINVSETSFGAFFSGMLGGLGSIFGLLGAALIVFFQLLSSTYSYFTIKPLLNQKDATASVAIFAFTLVTLGYVALFEQQSPSVLSFSILCLYLTAVCILTLPIVILKSFAALSSHSELENWGKEIEMWDFVEMDPRGFNRPSNIRDNPVFMLFESCLSYTKQENNLAALQCLRNLHKKALVSGPSEVLPRQAIAGYSKGVLFPVIEIAAQYENIEIVNAACELLFHYSQACAKGKQPWHEMIELKDSMEEALQVLAERGLDHSMNFALPLYANAILKNLELNCPPQEKIFFFNMEVINEDKNKTEAGDNELQWDQFGRDPIYAFINIGERALQKGQYSILKYIFQWMGYFANGAAQVKKLGLEQKRSIFESVQAAKLTLLKQIEKDNKYLKSYSILDHMLFFHGFESFELLTSHIFMQEFALISKVQDLGILNTLDLNTFCASAYTSVKDIFEKPQAKELICAVAEGVVRLAKKEMKLGWKIDKAAYKRHISQIREAVAKKSGNNPAVKKLLQKLENSEKTITKLKAPKRYPETLIWPTKSQV